MCEHGVEKKNVFITGVSGFIGQRIVERFSSREDIGEIIGIDIFAPPCYRDKMTFVKHDVRDDLIPVMSRHHIDWAIYAAFVISVIHDLQGDGRHDQGDLHARSSAKLKSPDRPGLGNGIVFCGRVPERPMSLMRYPWLAGNKKIKDAGYTFRYTTKETHETFAEQVRNFYGRGETGQSRRDRCADTSGRGLTP